MFPEQTRELWHALAVRGCVLRWRDHATGEIRTEPLAVGEQTLEVWKDGELLAFMGPMSGPVPPERLTPLGAFMVRQAADVLHVR